MNDLHKEHDRIEDSGFYYVIKNVDKLEDLEKEWSNYSSLHKDLRLRSDEKSIEIYGKNNFDRYKEMKSQLLAKDNFDIEDIPLESCRIIKQDRKIPRFIIKYKPEQKEQAVEWSNISSRYIVYPVDTLEELENLWRNYNNQHRQLQRESDWKSLELFGLNNQDHYEYLKSKFLYEDIDDEPEKEIHSSITEFPPTNLFEFSDIRSKDINDQINILENVIFNKKDLEINLDKFENGSKNVLLVTGFSGSGKSTLTKQLARKYKCTHYELDCLGFYLSGHLSIENIIGEEDGLIAFINKKKLQKTKKLNNNEMKDLYREYIKFLINWCKNQKGKFIIEGLQIYEVFEEGDSFITSCPIVIKGTSALVSAIRGAKRNSTDNNNSFLKEFKPLIAWALQDAKSLDNLIKSLNESKKINKEFPNKWYHLVPKNSNMSNGILSPYYMYSHDDLDLFHKSVDKYRDRISGGWGYYTDINPEDLTDDQIIDGLKKFRGEYGDRYIYLFRYPPHEKLGPNMKKLLKYKDVYEVDINKIPDIIDIDYGYIMSNSDQGKVNPEYYMNLSSEEYFKNYNDNSKMLFASINHISIATKSGKIPKKAIKKVTHSVFEMSTFELSCINLNESVGIEKDIKRMELSLYEAKTLSESIKKNKIITNSDNDEDTDFIDNKIPSVVPAFTPDEILDLGVYGNDNYYAEYKALKLDENYSSKDWFEEYQNVCTGIISEKTEDIFRARNVKLNDLISELYKHPDDLQLKQFILELGWNPEIPYTHENKLLSYKNTKNKLKDYYREFKYIDITNIDDIYYLSESVEEDENDLYPLYLIILSGNSVFSKYIKKFTHSKYSHSALSFDSKMNKLYSYNLDGNGLSFENFNGYGKDSEVLVNVIFLRKKDMIKLKSKLDYYIANYKNTNYSIKNIFNVIRNKVEDSDLNLICSQFVDKLLKFINIDITHKPSNLVTPKDLSEAKSNKIYTIYKGKISAYNQSKIDRKINKLKSSAKVFKEYFVNADKSIIEKYELSPIGEAKEFPVQFDKEGNLLIKNIKRLNYNEEYNKSHKLLLLYEKSNNIEGIKYELSKLWFMYNLLEKMKYSGKKLSEDELKSINDARARIQNDFQKYLTYIQKSENDFNFQIYYDNTPFSDAVYKVNASTLKYSKDLIKFLFF